MRETSNFVPIRLVRRRKCRTGTDGLYEEITNSKLFDKRSIKFEIDFVTWLWFQVLCSTVPVLLTWIFAITHRLHPMWEHFGHVQELGGTQWRVVHHIYIFRLDSKIIACITGAAWVPRDLRQTWSGIDAVALTRLVHDDAAPLAPAESPVHLFFY